MKRNAILVGSAIIGVIAGLIAAGGFGRPVADQPAVIQSDGFQIIVERLRAEAKAKSGGEIAISIDPELESTNNRRIVKATHKSPDSTTVYRFEFSHAEGGWACSEALADEVGTSGERTSHRLAAQAIEPEQLLKWLGW